MFADIPNPDDTVLLNLVKAYMVHGPCEQLNSNSTCIEKGHYTKNIQKNLPQKLKKVYLFTNKKGTISKTIKLKLILIINL